MFSARKSLIIPLILLAALSLGCGFSASIRPFTAEETVSQSFEVGASPHVVVETFNGGIQVMTEAGHTVQASVTKRGAGSSQAAAQDDLKNVEVKMTQEGDTVRIVARRTDGTINMGNSGASASLTVPTGATLELRTSNGTASVTGSTGDVAAHSSNGRLEVRGSTGHLDLDTSNGDIQVEAENAVVTAHTSNGQISFGGTLAKGDHSFRTSNGRIVLTLPSNASFRLDAETSNGKINSDFPVTHTGGSRETELRGTVGENPAVSIELRTSNGSIELRQDK